MVDGPRRRSHWAAGRARIAPFAIDGHGGSDDQFLGGRTRIEDGLQEVSRALDVSAGIPGNLVHGLADAHGCCQVIDSVDFRDNFFQCVQVTDISLNELALRREVRGKAVRVNLFVKTVEDSYRMSPLKQGVSSVRSNEASATENENLLHTLGKTRLR